jgi:hypothetical protein
LCFVRHTVTTTLSVSFVRFRAQFTSTTTACLTSKRNKDAIPAEHYRVRPQPRPTLLICYAGGSAPTSSPHVALKCHDPQWFRHRFAWVTRCRSATFRWVPRSIASDANRQGAQIAAPLAPPQRCWPVKARTHPGARSGEVRKIHIDAAPPLVKLPMKSTACVASAKPV